MYRFSLPPLFAAFLMFCERSRKSRLVALSDMCLPAFAADSTSRKGATFVFAKTTQGYLPGIPRGLQRIAFSCAALIARISGLEKRWQVYFT
jgi:hypothetical protein